MPCREHLTQLRDRKSLLNEVDASVLVISFEHPATVRRFGWYRNLPFIVLSDPSRRLYEAFGLEAASLSWLFDRQTIMSYARGVIHGHLPRLRRTDLRQLGGDVVLNRAGQATFVHRSETPADRPPIEVLLRMLRDAG